MSDPNERWKEAYPKVANDCHYSGITLGQAFANYLDRLNEEVFELQDSLLDDDRTVQEFVGKHATTLLNLNNMTSTMHKLSRQQ